MSKRTILCIPGDGIGPEIMQASMPILEYALKIAGMDYQLTHGVLGGAGVDKYGEPYPVATQTLARAADSILFGAIGGPKWDQLERKLRPESGLLAIRQDLQLFANLRPARLFRQLADASSLKPELVADLDLLIVRELTGGIYFGQPRGLVEENGRRRGFNTMVYDEDEIRAVARVAFAAAQRRQGRVCSVDKANVLEVSQLWREVVTQEAENWPDIVLSHMYVDNAAMQLVRTPKQFDVIVTSNLFGDILSDIAAMLTGSIGMLPSASLNAQHVGLYEPVHGSAPDIAGQDKANPLAMILSVSMMLRHSFGLVQVAERIEQAVGRVLDQGLRTVDLVSVSSDTTELSGDQLAPIGTKAMGHAILQAMQES